MSKSILLTVFLFFLSCTALAQNYSLTKSSIKNVIDRNKSNIKESNIIDLQEYIENIYINSSKYYNEGAMPLLTEGEFDVILIDKNNKKHMKKSSFFKGISPDKIIDFNYVKPFKGSLFDSYFGIITIKLKD